MGKIHRTRQSKLSFCSSVVDPPFTDPCRLQGNFPPPHSTNKSIRGLRPGRRHIKKYMAGQNSSVRSG